MPSQTEFKTNRTITGELCQEKWMHVKGLTSLTSRVCHREVFPSTLVSSTPSSVNNVSEQNKIKNKCDLHSVKIDY